MGPLEEPSLCTNSFKSGPTSVAEWMKRGCSSQTLLEAEKSEPGIRVAKAVVRPRIKVNVEQASWKRNYWIVSPPPGLEGLTPNPLWNIAEKATGMPRTQGIRHAGQSRTKKNTKRFLFAAMRTTQNGSNGQVVADLPVKNSANSKDLLG